MMKNVDNVSEIEWAQALHNKLSKESYRFVDALTNWTYRKMKQEVIEEARMIEFLDPDSSPHIEDQSEFFESIVRLQDIFDLSIWDPNRELDLNCLTGDKLESVIAEIFDHPIDNVYPYSHYVARVLFNLFRLFLQDTKKEE